MIEVTILCILTVLTFLLMWPYFQWLRSNSAFSDRSSKLHKSRLFERTSVQLSLIVPAYNEAERLPIMLKDTCNYLARKNVTYEIIVVDDGSVDETSAVAATFPSVQVVKLTSNQGKGAAVKAGMLHARGERLLMVDADGATEIGDLDKLMRLLDASSVEVVFGSRAHLEKSAQVAKRSKLRNFLMKGFHLCVRLFVGSEIRDTQCGFKLFSRSAAQLLFPSLHLSRWAFDIELVELCRRLDLRVAEVPVNWHEVDGSKLNVVTASIQMLRDMASVRLCYSLGLWTPKISTKFFS
jgi:dolichyl-phosphate beta-glucosyltransferase